MIKSTILSLSVGLLAIGGVAAEEGPAKPEKPKLSGILAMQLEISEATYKAQPSIKNKAQLLEVMEKIVNKKCFVSSSKARNYNPQKSSEECKAIVEKTLELVPSSPPALCAEHGLNSKQCEEAYAQQKIEGIAASSANANSFPLEFKLAESKSQITRERYRKVIDSLTMAQNNNGQAEEQKNKLHKAAFSLLESSCRQRQVQLSELASSQVPFRKVLILEGCIQDLDFVRKSVPSFSSLICYLQGWFSPNCIKSLEKARLATGAKTTSEQSEDDLVSF